MVSWIMGPSRSGKSEEIYRRMQRAVQEGKRAFLLVPDQCSFDREREMQKRFSNQNSREILVLSFSRLADYIFKSYGGLAKEYATKTIKVMLMHQAVQELSAHLDYFQSSLKKPGLHSLLVQTVDEMENAALLPEEFLTFTDTIRKPQLQIKAKDVALIYQRYRRLLTERCRDPLEDLPRAVEMIHKADFFSHSSVFIEDFISFSGVQLDCLAEMMRQTDVTISLCYAKNDPLFEPAYKTYQTICKKAREENLPVCDSYYADTIADLPEDLYAVSSRCLRFYTGGKAPENKGHVHLFLAKNEYAEIDHILSAVWELVREKGYRFRDILLLTGDLEPFRDLLISGCKRYQIPYYIDEELSMNYHPLFRCIFGLLESSLHKTIDLDAAIQMLKSGMTSFTYEQIACFENYLFTWRITPKQMLSSFTHHPRGFLPKEEMTALDTEALLFAEEIRKKVIQSVQMLKNAGDTVQDKVEALMNGLNELGVVQTMELQISHLCSKKPEEAKEQKRFWDVLIDILETMDRMMGDRALSLPEFTELFQIAAEDYHLGTIPQTLDSVLIGSAHHTLSGCYKVVFLFGASEGVFPHTPGMTGIFTAQDREHFRDCGSSFSRPMTDRIAQERLIAYQVLCKPSERLFISAHLADISGNPCEPSEVFGQITELLGEGVLQTQEDDPLYLSCNEETAFLQLAYHYRSHSESVEALRQYFREDPRLKALDDLQNPGIYQLKKPHLLPNATERGFSLSPTQVERYYRCPFLYFCTNIIQVFPRSRAELTGLSIGSMVHFALENLLQDARFLEWEKNELARKIQNVIGEYLEKYMGGEQDKPAYFISRMQRWRERLLILCLHIQRELLVSDFRPKAFEMKLGHGEKQKSFLAPLPDGGMVKVIGTVDRVDTFQKDEKEYLRVIDYKSGAGKVFTLSDIYYGLNLQMLLYLFSQCQGEGAVPAGALYLPTTGCLTEYVLSRRQEGDNPVEKKVEESFCMSGLMLDQPFILDAMEKVEDETSGVFLPLKKKKDVYQAGSRGVLVSMEQLNLLREFVKKQLVDMCVRLRRGEIGAVPLIDPKVEYKPCDYCDYRTVCGYREGMPFREKQKMSTEESFEKMDEEAKEWQRGGKY